MAIGPADPTLTDSTLVERVARREAAALGELYDRHHRLLFTLIHRVLRDRGEAEDVLQDVFVRVWDRAESYNPALGAPSAWLARIARNRAIDRLRSRGVRAHLADPLDRVPLAADVATAPDPEEQTHAAEHRRIVRAALDALPPEQRTLIDAAYYDGYTQSELAEKFDLPLGTVKTRIRTAMQALRASLAR